MSVVGRLDVFFSWQSRTNANVTIDLSVILSCHDTEYTCQFFDQDAEELQVLPSPV